MKCKNCQTTCFTEGGFCPKCGMKLNVPSHKKMIILISLMLLFFGVFLVGCFFFF